MTGGAFKYLEVPVLYSLFHCADVGSKNVLGTSFIMFMINAVFSG